MNRTITDEFMERIPNDSDKRLLITFPNLHNIQVQQVSRGYTEETSISNSISIPMKSNQWKPLISILTPCSSDSDISEIESAYGYSIDEDKVAISCKRGQKMYTIGLRADFMVKFDDSTKRPSYAFETGCKVFHDYESDAYFMYVSETRDEYAFAFNGAFLALSDS